MKYDFLILGADGLQGQIVTKYLLLKKYRVLTSDIYSSNVKPILKLYGRKKSHFKYCDLRNPLEATRLVQASGAPILINCADMYWNLNVYKACLKARTHCVDLGSWIELTRDQLKLDDAFKKIKRVAITGCGSVPGIGNVMLAYAAKKFDLIESVDVGFSWNSNIKTFVQPFSMKSILEEFTYDPRVVKDGRWERRQPLEVWMRKKFRLIGRQKVFLVQHPELYTFKRYFRHKGLKNIRFFAGFPEHSLEKIYTLIELGFQYPRAVKIPELGVKIAPLDLLNPVLKRLRTPPGYTESENLWLKIRGRVNSKTKKILMECLVPPIRGWEDSGCNIDTGFSACIIAEMIRNKVIKESGSFAPESVVPERQFFQALQKEGMAIYENGKEILY